jgi:hypothetical protein
MLTRLATLAIVFATTFTTASAGRFATAPTRASVRAALVKHRAHNLASLHRYVTTGVYPHNTYRTGPLNLCAAATIISLDHHPDLVAETAKTNVNLRLLDVTSGPLLDWMLTSGLTLEEIDRIQEPGFMPDRPTEQAYRREDAKLRRDYTATEAFLKRHAAADLEEATTRLMARPDLARTLVSQASQGVSTPLDGGAEWK